jgi:hypothetical protein
MADGTGKPSQFGLDYLEKYGTSVQGGSTIKAGAGFDVGAYMGASVQPGSPGSQVYMGPNKGVMNPGLLAGGPGMINAFTNSSTQKYEDARMAPVSWDEKQKRDFISKGILYKMPGFDYNMGMPEIMDTWDSLLKSAQAFSKSGAEWSPWDVMASYANDGKGFGTIRKGDWEYDARTGEKVKYVGPRTKTTTSKNVNLSSPEDVKALTTQMLTELLGRAPTPDELAKYRSSINGYERSNPEMTTTVHTLNDQGEEVGQSSTTAGGASQAALGGIVSEGAKKGPEYGKYQAGTTYFNALMQMIAGG